MGILSAADELALETKLKTIGYWLVEAKPCAPTRHKREVRVKRRELAEFCGNLATLLEAGLSLVDAMRTLEREIALPGFKRVITDVRLNVETGSSLSEALARHPKIFDDQLRNTLAAGEYGGNLPESLQSITRYLEWMERLVADVKQASTYPVIVVAVLLAFVMLLFGFVVPRFTAILTELGLELPLITKIVIGDQQDPWRIRRIGQSAVLAIWRERRIDGGKKSWINIVATEKPALVATDFVGGHARFSGEHRHPPRRIRNLLAAQDDTFQRLGERV